MKMEMISKAHLKDLARLNIKKFREASDLILVEGLRTIDHLVENNIPLLELYLDEQHQDITYPAAKTFYLRPDQFARITSTRNPQNIAALIRKQAVALKDRKFILYLDQISDPGNLGTIIRTAQAAGVSGIVLAPDSCSIYNPKAIRAAVGSVFTIPIEIRDADWLKQSNSWKIALNLADAENLFEIHEIPDEVILIVGSEAHGLRKKILELVDISVKIPLQNKIESLNAAVAAGIALYHLLK